MSPEVEEKLREIARERKRIEENVIDRKLFIRESYQFVRAEKSYAEAFYEA